MLPTPTLDALIRYAVTHHASDVHLAPDHPPSFRLNGIIHHASKEFPRLSASATRDLLCGMLRPNELQLLEERLEIDLSREFDNAGEPVRCRINIHQQQQGLGAVLRLINRVIPQPGELDLEEAVVRLAKLPRGLVLVTGATGMGKTTTITCLIDLINRSSRKHILTIEDPVEFIHSRQQSIVTQRELGSHTHDFARALKSALRLDPDVIFVGEMRDLETIKLVLTASETGHLVFSTLHTTDAAQSIDRIIDVFPANQQPMVRMQLAGVLQAVVSQVLVPRASGQGRIAAREIMLASPAIRTLIRDNNTHQIYGSLCSSVHEGMCPLELSLAQKVRKDLIEHSEAEVVANRPAMLNKYIYSKSQLDSNLERLPAARSVVAPRPGGGRQADDNEEMRSWA